MTREEIDAHNNGLIIGMTMGLSVVNKSGSPDPPTPTPAIIPTVRYIDFDGTILLSVPTEQYVSPPPVPDHSDLELVFQKWNRNLTNIDKDKSYDVGAMYATADGKTHLHVTMTEITGRSLTMNLNKRWGGVLLIDWGDGTTTTHSSRGVVGIPHTYSSVGTYVIKIRMNTEGDTYEFGGFGNGLFGMENYILRKAYIANDVAAVGEYAFYNCYLLHSIILPDGVLSIDSYAFNRCTSLRAVIIPNGVTRLGSYSFSYCRSLQSVTIPDSVTDIGSLTVQRGYVFQFCSALKSIVIPDGVTTIGPQSFANCSSLSHIVIPNGVTIIEPRLFYFCYALSHVTIPNNVTIIDEHVFQGCSSLYSVLFPDTITTIGRSAFANCVALALITIPYSVTRTGDNVFSQCDSLRSITITSETPFTMGAMSGLSPGLQIFVPDNSVEAYKTAWSALANYIYPMSAKTEA